MNRHDNDVIRRVSPNIVAFGIGLGIAWLLEWETADLVWSLWLCSLTLGYLTILSALGGGAYVGWHLIRHEDFQKKHLIPAILAGTGMGLFLLGFFSLHFCGFHAGHSVFLNQFFPIDGMPKDGFGDAFMNPFLLWTLVLKHLAQPYGVFLIPALIVERKHVFSALIKAIHIVRDGINVKSSENGSVKASGKNTAPEFFGTAMGRPYLNVVRMHVLIFFFAFCHFLGIDSFAVYAVVYFVYFFPWGEIIKLNKSNRNIEAEGGR